MKHLKETLKVAAQANVNVMIMGRHGVGKTAVVESLKDEGFFVKTIILSQMDPFLLGGMPWRQEREGQLESVFATPDWINEVRQAEADGMKPVVFLDEFNRADRYAFAAALRLVNEKCINGHQLPKSTVFFAAINPETEGDEDIAFLNDPTMDRWAHICVHTDADVFLDWGRNAGINSNVLNFLSVNKNAVTDFDMESLFESQIISRVGATQRSWEAVAKIQSVIDELAGDDESTFKSLVEGVGFRLFQGLVGREHALQYIQYTLENFSKPFTVKEMMKPTKKVLKRVKELVESNQTEIIIASIDNAFHEIPGVVGEPSLEAVKGFLDFLFELPKDIQAGFWFRSNDDDKGNVETANFWKHIVLRTWGTEYHKKLSELRKQ